MMKKKVMNDNLPRRVIVAVNQLKIKKVGGTNEVVPRGD